MLNYLLSLKLLPEELKQTNTPEVLLNQLGNPYQLRAKALDEPLTSYELGRVLLHLVQRRGFLSNRKRLAGDMVDDPDVQAILNDNKCSQEMNKEQAKEEKVFLGDVAELREKIIESGSRTLGEYLASFAFHDCQRNRSHEGGHLRTDRRMYQEELSLIWQEQEKHHSILTKKVKEAVEEIIFKQRPLKLRLDRIGKCSLEPKNQRANIARLECQRFRYLQDINNLEYFEPNTEQYKHFHDEDRKKVIDLFEHTEKVTFAQIRKTLGLDIKVKFNLEQDNKYLKGNTTACKIRLVLPDWNNFDADKQMALVEDLLTIKEKSALTKRLIKHWQFERVTAIQLMLLEFEPGHSNLSTKAIRKLLPFLQQGKIYSDARIAAGYGYEQKATAKEQRLPKPPQVSNPIVQKGLHELRRLINAIIAEYGKPDAIRIELARDLEMNTKQYARYKKLLQDNNKANQDAEEAYREVARLNPSLNLGSYPSEDDKIKYRLWCDQNTCCAYCGKSIEKASLFSHNFEVDHILPYSKSIDNSYTNKVLCCLSHNHYKGQRTPIEAFGHMTEQWNQITQAIQRWGKHNNDYKRLAGKLKKFYMTSEDIKKSDFVNRQLNDTRYFSRLANDYLKQLVDVDVSVTKGILVSFVRRQWGLNSLLNNRYLKDSDKKNRSDHRHHIIDAVVIGCIDRSFYQQLIKLAKAIEEKGSLSNINKISISPPWEALRSELKMALDNIIVSHVSQRKLSGALHEATGAGFIEGYGNVYRRIINSKFSIKQVNSIIDPAVKEIVIKHLENYDNDPKKAFSNENPVFHRDGKTPIKRVRIIQSKQTREKLENDKYGVRNKEGKIFKWLPYGNYHHVEILRNKVTGKISGEFVTMMEAHHRVKGIKMPKQPIVKTDHGNELEFLMALHINDIVSLPDGDQRKFFRIQKTVKDNKALMLRLHTAATIVCKEEATNLKLADLITKDVIKHHINVLGKEISHKQHVNVLEKEKEIAE